MGRLFDNPLIVLVILLVILLLFGAPKLPGMARSLGQSMRIFKSEVKEMKKDDQPHGFGVATNGDPVHDRRNIPPQPGTTGLDAIPNPDQRTGSPTA